SAGSWSLARVHCIRRDGSRAKSREVEGGRPSPNEGAPKGKRCDRPGDDVSVNNSGQGFDLNFVTLLTAGTGIRLNADQGWATIRGPFVLRFCDGCTLKEAFPCFEQLCEDSCSA